MSSVESDYRSVTELTRWTFECREIRKWAEERLSGRVLNACCGKSKLNHSGEIVRNDLDTEVDADYHLDVAELPAHLERESFDVVIYDPPWSHYQSNMRYDGRQVEKGDVAIDMSEHPLSIDREKQQVGHARLAKDGFDYLLKPGGIVIQLTLHGTCMPSRLNYEQVERVMFDPIGEAKIVIGSVDKKTQTKLSNLA